MSDIKVGDLVMVVKPGCTDALLGFIFIVNDIRPQTFPCKSCGTFHGQKYGDPLAFIDRNDHSGFNLYRLKKIPPLSEPETTEHRETVEA